MKKLGGILFLYTTQSFQSVFSLKNECIHRLKEEQKDKELKAFDKQNKEHYKSLFDEKVKSELENRAQQNAEKEKFWK